MTESKLREALQLNLPTINAHCTVLEDIHRGDPNAGGTIPELTACIRRCVSEISQALRPPTTEGTPTETPKTTRDVLVDDLIATKTPKHSETPVTDLVRALFARKQTFSTERSEAIEQVEDLERTLHAKERELGAPIDMLLFCPQCDYQHVDEPQPHKDWTNPPHRSHQCQKCGHIWRPCDRTTNGVAKIATNGQHDLSADPATLQSVSAAPQGKVEPFVVKHYGNDSFPTIKGNGFDGLQIGEDRAEADEFIAWINARLSALPSGYVQVPREPDHKIIYAMAERMYEGKVPAADSIEYALWVEVWKAGITAAQRKS